VLNQPTSSTIARNSIFYNNYGGNISGSQGSLKIEYSNIIPSVVW
jgi:hypothetical protein